MSLEVRSGGDTRASILTIGMSFGGTAAGTGNGVRRRFGGDTTSMSAPATSSPSPVCKEKKIKEMEKGEDVAVVRPRENAP